MVMKLQTIDKTPLIKVLYEQLTKIYALLVTVS